ncbi:MAG TPA: hypothetical protein VG253_19645 [Streptosporangiaceae bacterium]|nr:hypothetical protein [Streptosporangiaceae bacterium]
MPTLVGAASCFVTSCRAAFSPALEDALLLVLAACDCVELPVAELEHADSRHTAEIKAATSSHLERRIC